MAETEYLCAKCSRINLRAAFDRSDNFRTRWDYDQERHFPVRQLHNHDRRDEPMVEAIEIAVMDKYVGWDDQCLLCKFLQTISPKHSATNGWSRLELFAFSTLQRSHLIVPLKLEEQRTPFFDRSFMTLMAPTSSLGYYHLRDSSRDGTILRVSNDEHPLLSEDNGIWGRIVPEVIDFKLVHQWLGFCCSHHSKCARPQSGGQLQGFRLINCSNDPPTVEDHPITASYVALSYVWSSSTHNSSKISNVVLDAVAATKKLGFQYLWVDRLCIDRERDDEKLFLISNMDRIYQQAELTLVAAVPDYDGLPGIHEWSRKRTKQPQIILGDMQLVSSLTDPVKLITESPWHQRGWTFQEGILSRRLLVFTSEQLYWSCCGMTAQESVQVPASLSHLPDKSQMGDWMTLGPFHGSTRSSYAPGTWDKSKVSPKVVAGKIIRDFVEDIATYTQRTLTYDTDSLSAFKGVMQLYAAAAGVDNIEFILGLPICLNAFPNVCSAFMAAVTDWSHDEPIADSGRLCWRRPHLPSWTWVGWGGTVSEKSSFQKTLNKLVSPEHSWTHPSRDYTPEVHVSLKDAPSSPEFPLEHWIRGYAGEDTYVLLTIQQPFVVDPCTVFPAAGKNKISLNKHKFNIPVYLTVTEPLGPTGSADRQAEVIKRLRNETYKAVLAWWNLEDLHNSMVSVISVGFLLLKPTGEQRDGKVVYERIGSLRRAVPSHLIGGGCATIDDFVAFAGLLRSEADVCLV